MTRSIRPALIVVTDTTVAPEGLLEERIERALALARPYTVLVQLRDRTLPVRARFALGRRLSALCRRHTQWLAVNDSVDLALLLGADGLHLGELSISPLRARALAPESFISHACHDVAGVRVPGSDAAVLSPIVAERKGRAALGTGVLRRIADGLAAEGTPEKIPTALYALGGIDASSAAACVANGANGVAVIGAALDGRDVTPLLRALGILRSGA